MHRVRVRTLSPAGRACRRRHAPLAHGRAPGDGDGHWAPVAAAPARRGQGRDAVSGGLQDRISQGSGYPERVAERSTGRQGKGSSEIVEAFAASLAQITKSFSRLESICGCLFLR
jgi:hypothetical protein